MFLDNRPLRIKGEGLTCCFPNRITAEAAAWEWQTVGPGGLSNPQAFPVVRRGTYIKKTRHLWRVGFKQASKLQHKRKA